MTMSRKWLIINKVQDKTSRKAIFYSKNKCKGKIEIKTMNEYFVSITDSKQNKHLLL